MTITFILISFLSVDGQELLDGQKRWSSENKLSINDFNIKVSDNYNEAIYSQFMISNQVGGFDFLKRNLNKKVQNLFLGNASWIDTLMVSKNINEKLKLHQLQFDLSEVYARKFRKRLLINKGKIAKGFSIVSELSNKIMSEYSKESSLLMRETKRGDDKEKLDSWSKKINQWLEELNEFRYENRKRIKIK